MKLKMCLMMKFKYNKITSKFLILVIGVIGVVSIIIFLFGNLKMDSLHQTGLKLMKISLEKLMIHNINGTCSKDIIYSLQETSQQTCLIYNMVPKCGSRGMRDTYKKLGKELNYTSLRGKYGYEYINSTHRHPYNVMKEVLRNAECDRPNKHVYNRHQAFSDFKMISQKTPFYTNIIRDPVNHYISWYFFRRSYGHGLDPLKYFYNRSYYNTLEWAEAKNMSFDDCVESNHEECRSSEYTYRMIPYFCGIDYNCVKPSEWSLAQAQRNIVKHFPAVGYLENLVQYLELCEVIWPQFFTGAASMVRNDTSQHANYSPKRAKYEPSEKTKLIMKGRLGLEYRFYDWVKQRFACMYEYYVRGSKRHHV